MSSDFPNPYAERAEGLKGRKPELIADVRLFTTEAGGKLYPVWPGWGGGCLPDIANPSGSFDGWPLLEEPIFPGEERPCVGFVFIHPTAAEILRSHGRFFLTEGKRVGVAVVVQ
jgi:hypothetical protein